MPEHELLKVEEVATLTRRTAQALYNERHRGEGIGALGVKVGKRILWRRRDIDAWIDEQVAASRESVAS